MRTLPLILGLLCAAPAREEGGAKGGAMRLSCPVFSENQSIPAKYTCDGDDINPPLEIEGVPLGTKSLALIVDDPDAPSKTWIHWTAWNIAPDVRRIEEGQAPAGLSGGSAVQGKNDFGKTGWGGPCPPGGTHHYRFKVYALGTVLDLAAGAKAPALEKAMQGHTLAQADWTGVYARVR